MHAQIRDDIVKAKEAEVVATAEDDRHFRLRVKCAVTILVVFSVTILLRWPQIDRPLSAHHEFLTAVVLTRLSIWYDQGLLRSRFAPLTTYAGAANKYIDNTGVRFSPRDADGNYYYVSFPPAGYAVPYMIFRLTGIRPNETGLRIFNLGVHLASVVVVFWITLGLIEPRVESYVGATASAIAYMLFPATLWYHSNAYMGDTFVQLPWLLAILSLIRYYHTQRAFGHERTLWLTLVGITVALAVLTASLGIVLVPFIIGLEVFRANRAAREISWPLLGVVLISLGLALGMWFLTYSLPVGVQELAKSLLQKLLYRTGVAEVVPITSFLKAIGKYLLLGYGPYLMGFVLVAASVWRKPPGSHAVGKDLVLMVGLLPPIANTVIFAQWSLIHEYSVLYLAVPLAICIGIYVAQEWRRRLSLWGSYRSKRNAAGIIVSCAVYSAVVYYVFFANDFWTLAHRLVDMQYPKLGQALPKVNYGMATGLFIPSSLYKDAGACIGAVPSPDSIVFLNVWDVAQLVYYSQRNLKVVSGNEEAFAFMRMRNAADGTMFFFDDLYRVERVEVLRLNGGLAEINVLPALPPECPQVTPGRPAD